MANDLARSNANREIDIVSDYIRNADTHRMYNAIRKSKREARKRNERATRRNGKREKPVLLPSFNSLPEPLAVEVDNAGYRSTANEMEVLIPSSADQKIKMMSRPTKSTRSAALDSFEVGLPNVYSHQRFSSSSRAGANRKPLVAENNTVVYLDYEKDTDLAIQSFGDSARILTVLNGPGAPSEFSYDIEIPSGGRLRKDVKSGGVFVLNNQDIPIGGFSPAWAMDSEGKAVKTRYEIRNNTLVQIVKHTESALSYPIVADPLWGINLISSATWYRRAQYGYYGWRYEVVPSWWARYWGTKPASSYYVGALGWNELRYRWANSGGMRDQFICHQQFAFLKSVWGLDMWRPDVSYARTVATGCNP